MRSTHTITPQKGTAGAPIPSQGGGGVASRLPRHDGYPEFHTYLDTGCHVSPSCLRCPLPSCLYDRSRGAQAATKALRQRFIFYARAHHIPWPTISLYLRLSLRRVYGLAKESRDSGTLTLQLGFASLDPLPSTIRREKAKVS